MIGDNYSVKSVVSGSCLRPYRIVNRRWDDRTPSGRFNLYVYKRSHNWQNPPDLWIDVPCGKCQGCVRDKSRMWRVRLLHEYMFGQHQSCICVTLTVSDDHMSEFQSLQDVKKVFRDFLNRLRYYTFDGKLPKRFFISELGDKTGRLHFHGFIFDLGCSYQDVRRSWKCGFIWIDPVRSVKQFTYCTKYLTKPSVRWFKPQVFVSPGLGQSYVSRASSVSYHHGYGSGDYNFTVRIGDFTYRLPQYYKAKLFTRREMDDYKANVAQSDRPEKFVLSGHTYEDKRHYYEARKRFLQASIRSNLSQDLIDYSDTVLNDVSGDCPISELDEFPAFSDQDYPKM